MASIKLYLDTRKEKKDGTYPLKVSVSHKNSFLINLNVYLTKEQWINNEVVIPEDKNLSKSLNKYISTRFSGMETTLLRLRAFGELQKMSDAELREALDTNFTKKEESPLLFKERAEAYTATLERTSTKSTFDIMLKKVEVFSNIETLTFEDITYSWLKDFEYFLKHTENLRTNSISIYIRNIRTIFNDAIDRDMISQNLYPFRKFKIQNERTRKRALTVEQLIQFRDYECDPDYEQYRDIFMLIFYLAGINIIDLCNLTEITPDGYIEYKRAKTGRLYKIKVEPEAMAIIEKYKGKNYLIDILDRYSDHKNYISKINRMLKEIGPVEYVKNESKAKGKRTNSGPPKKVRKGLFPELSTYWARHTWATLAASIDIPKETIAATLGHNTNSITDIYIDFDQKKIDKAIRDVIDHINSFENEEASN